MVTIATLKYLAAQKLGDANTLFKYGRNGGATYLMGYALEFSFKRKISLVLNFNNGFPETPLELNSYGAQLAAFNNINTGIQLTQLKQIKNHKLQQLLVFSGAQSRIISLYLNEWLNVSSWNPEDRYKRHRFTKQKTQEFMYSAKIILQQIS